jgi:hypothetical protein
MHSVAPIPAQAPTPVISFPAPVAWNEVCTFLHVASMGPSPLWEAWVPVQHQVWHRRAVCMASLRDVKWTVTFIHSFLNC